MKGDVEHIDQIQFTESAGPIKRKKEEKKRKRREQKPE
jgi:hypothetical protein